MTLRALVAVALAASVLAAGAEPNWSLRVLGVAQDAGMPHLGCDDWVCASVHRGERSRARVASVGVRDAASGRAFLFDATPDFPAQLRDLTDGAPPEGIFLTHAHIGHYTGLMYLGKESIAARGVPLYVTASMADYLRRSGPWSLLVADGHVALEVMALDHAIDLGGLRVTPFAVPHRDEFSDTVGYRIDGPRRSIVFIPDIDQWERWKRDVRGLADDVDLMLVDGTFASADEIGRPIEQVPHPLIPHTRALLAGTRALLRFIHLNHTNREWDAPDVVHDGEEFPL